MNKDRKKYIMMVLENGGYLQYGAKIRIDTCEQLLQEKLGSDAYVFGLMQ